MKVTSEDYNAIKQAIIIKLQENGVTFLGLEKIYQAEKLSHMRFIWDLFWLSKWSRDDENRSKNYMDTHITTVLEKIYKDLSI